MGNLTSYQRDLLLDVLSKERIIQNGYYAYNYRGKRYLEHRILLELILNKKLKNSDVVHHKDHDKSNNCFQNLQVMNNYEHLSLHHAGSKKPTSNQNPSNKLTKEKINKMIELSKKIIKKNGRPNYSKIGKELDISGFTVARYLGVETKG